MHRHIQRAAACATVLLTLALSLTWAQTSFRAEAGDSVTIGGVTMVLEHAVVITISPDGTPSIARAPSRAASTENAPANPTEQSTEQGTEQSADNANAHSSQTNAPESRRLALPTEIIPSSQTVDIHVHSQPEGAEVYIYINDEAQLLGQTPLSSELTSEEAVIILLLAPGYEPYSDRIIPQAGKRLDIRLEASATPSSADPAQASTSNTTNSNANNGGVWLGDQGSSTAAGAQLSSQSNTPSFPSATPICIGGAWVASYTDAQGNSVPGYCRANTSSGTGPDQLSNRRVGNSSNGSGLEFRGAMSAQVNYLSPLRRCSDFASQTEAQNFFDFAAIASSQRDFHNLDPSGSGRACAHFFR